MRKGEINSLLYSFSFSFSTAGSAWTQRLAIQHHLTYSSISHTWSYYIKGHITYRVISHTGSYYIQGHITYRVISHTGSYHIQGHITYRVISHTGSYHIQGHPPSTSLSNVTGVVQGWAGHRGSLLLRVVQITILPFKSNQIYLR